MSRMWPLPHAFASADLFREEGWQKKEGRLLFRGQEIFCPAGSEEDFLRLLPGAEENQKMLRWFFAPVLSIREARPSDLEEICRLKEEVIQGSFSFFSKREMDEALRRSASLDYMREEIEANRFLLALKEEEIWAIAGLRALNQQEGFLYSLYSKGNKAGAALVSCLLLLAQEESLLRISSNVYQENGFAKKALAQFGFVSRGEPEESTYVSGYLIERLLLEF